MAPDFSPLSDDQLLELVRAALREISARGPGLSAAARDAMLDEAERARIAKDATEREAATMRAEERARIAAEAAARVRAAHADQAADEARERAVKSAEATKGWLRSAAALVNLQPAEITLMILDTRFGRRVLINKGRDRFTHDHLVDWNRTDGSIKTTRKLVARKPDLAALAAKFEAKNAGKTLVLTGADHDWTGEAA